MVRSPTCIRKTKAIYDYSDLFSSGTCDKRDVRA
jgi:hypothetical protein